MLTAKAQVKFFTLLSLAVLVLAFFVIKPYLTALFLAVIFVTAFIPVHRFIRRAVGGFQNLAALLSTALVLLIILVPVAVFGFLVFQEAQEMYQKSMEEGFMFGSLEEVIITMEENISEMVPGLDLDIRHYAEIEGVIQQGVGFVVNYYDKVLAGFIHLGIGTFLTVLGTFYLFRDGGKVLKKIRKLSPFKREYTNMIIDKIAETVNAVVRGRLLVGVIMGFLVGVGFALFNLPSPLLWGCVTAIASMLPVLGPMLIIIPTSLVLFFSGIIWSAIGILAWGTISVILIDEYLSSVLIDQRMQIHPFLVLVSVIGGISFFGPIGFVVGPVVLALLFAILDIYPLITKPEAYEGQWVVLGDNDYEQ
ncbi:MAG: AI-2E family transporter [Candidatus Paceibacterota bacterium]